MAEIQKTPGSTEKAVQQQQGPDAGRSRGGQDVASAADSPDKGMGGAGDNDETVFPEAHRTPAGSSERNR